MLRTTAASHARNDDSSHPETKRPSPLFDRLRAGTASAHRDLESRMELASDALDAPRYVQALRNFRRAHGAYEAVAGPVLPAGLRPLFESRLKTTLLDADLRHFGARECHREEDVTAVRTLIGHDPRAAVGAMYVFEGSTLGGGVVARHLERTLGLSTLEGRHYFTPYPGRTGAMWRAFKQGVDDDAVGRDPVAADAIVAAAAATFAWLARVLPVKV